MQGSGLSLTIGRIQIVAGRRQERGSCRSLHDRGFPGRPLDRKLQFYLGESRKLLPDLEATYDQLVARIQANGVDISSQP